MFRSNKPPWTIVAAIQNKQLMWHLGSVMASKVNTVLSSEHRSTLLLFLHLVMSLHRLDNVPVQK